LVQNKIVKKKKWISLLGEGLYGPVHVSMHYPIWKIKVQLKNCTVALKFGFLESSSWIGPAWFFHLQITPLSWYGT